LATTITGSPSLSSTSYSGSGPRDLHSFPTRRSSDLANYSFAFVSGTLTVSPAALTVTAVNATRAYGASTPALTVSYSGFVNGDKTASPHASTTVTTTAPTPSGAGTYTITASGAVSAN